MVGPMVGTASKAQFRQRWEACLAHAKRLGLVDNRTTMQAFRKGFVSNTRKLTVGKKLLERSRYTDEQYYI